MASAADTARAASNGVKARPAPPNAELPRQMERSEKRIIWLKLDEVYGDETTGYQPGWTDARVAKDLDVALAWVKTVREENFGPVGTNPEIALVVAEAEAWRKDRAELGKKALTQVAQLAADGERLTTRGEIIERTLAGIEKAVK